MCHYCPILILITAFITKCHSFEFKAVLFLKSPDECLIKLVDDDRKVWELEINEDYDVTAKKTEMTVKNKLFDEISKYDYVSLVAFFTSGDSKSVWGANIRSPHWTRNIPRNYYAHFNLKMKLIREQPKLYLFDGYRTPLLHVPTLEVDCSKRLYHYFVGQVHSKTESARVLVYDYEDETYFDLDDGYKFTVKHYAKKSTEDLVPYYLIKLDEKGINTIAIYRNFRYAVGHIKDLLKLRNSYTKKIHRDSSYYH